MPVAMPFRFEHVDHASVATLPVAPLARGSRRARRRGIEGAQAVVETDDDVVEGATVGVV